MDVKFNEPLYRMPQRAAPLQSPLVRLCIKMGVAQDIQGAHKVLLVIVIIAFTIALVVPFLTRDLSLPDDGKGYEIASPTAL